MSKEEKLSKAFLYAALLKIYGSEYRGCFFDIIDEFFYWLDGGILNFDAQNNASSNLQTENLYNDDK